jgi:TonB family protein
MALLSRRYGLCGAAFHLLCATVFFIISTSAQTQPETLDQRALVQRTAPIYPSLARNMALQGVVRLEAVVAPDGSVKAVEVKGGHPVLAQAAANAVRQWRWQRAVRETHEAVAVLFTRE